MSQSQTTARVVSPEVAMVILVYNHGLSSSEALAQVWRVLEKEHQHEPE